MGLNLTVYKIRHAIPVPGTARPAGCSHCRQDCVAFRTPMRTGRPELDIAAIFFIDQNGFYFNKIIDIFNVFH
jgi:hypothetical protein